MLDQEVEANFLSSPAPLGLQDAPRRVSDTDSWGKLTYNSQISLLTVCLSDDGSLVTGLVVSYYDVALDSSFDLETHGDLSGGNCATYDVNQGQ